MSPGPGPDCRNPVKSVQANPAAPTSAETVRGTSAAISGPGPRSTFGALYKGESGTNTASGAAPKTKAEFEELYKDIFQDLAGSDNEGDQEPYDQRGAEEYAKKFECGRVLNDHYDKAKYVSRLGTYLAQVGGDSARATQRARLRAENVFKADYEEISVQECRRREVREKHELLLPYPTTGNTETINDYGDYSDKEWTAAEREDELSGPPVNVGSVEDNNNEDEPDGRAEERKPVINLKHSPDHQTA